MRASTGNLLVLTDLAPRSDPAVRLAGSLSLAHGWCLRVAHVLGLSGAGRGDGIPDFTELHARILAADREARAQMLRLIPGMVRPTAPLIDLDGPSGALVRHAAQLRPVLVVLPFAWDWDRSGRDPTALAPALLERVSAPLLFVGDAVRAPIRRVLILVAPQALESTLVADAGRWAAWLNGALDVGPHAGAPEVEIALLEAGAAGRDWTALFDSAPADLLILPRTSLKTDACDAVHEAFKAVLAGAPAPTLVPSAMGRTPPASGARTLEYHGYVRRPA
ncbi:MAG TPA: hypothetical protein VKZ58_07430 [Longimicrobiales bacterium]|nr:hypothetical protein [Longimicrobiales bacterium]